MARKTKKQRNFDERIGQVLRRYRKAKKVPMKQVVEKTGISVTAYRKYEMGETTIGLTMLIKTADIIGVSIHDIIEEVIKEEIRGRTPQQERVVMMLERLPEKAVRKLERLVSVVVKDRI